jgi:peptidoglycan glycosyltransferase
LLFAGLAAAALVNGWWSVYRGPSLLTRTDNPRRAISDLSVPRGAILDRNNAPLSITSGSPGALVRQYLYPALGPVLGYTSPTYGQSGLEASLDAYLRGLQGNPGLTIWWNHLLLGQPPPGLDVRLSLDLALQTAADQALAGEAAALALIDAASGEILAMASHPGFDANRLEQDWPALIQAEDSPLVNRAAQGGYSPGAALGPLLLAAHLELPGGLPALPADPHLTLDGVRLPCAVEPEAASWEAWIAAGCPAASLRLAESLAAQAPERLPASLAGFGLFGAPALRLPVLASSRPPAGLAPQALLWGQAGGGQGVLVSPLQMSLAAAALTRQGLLPAPRLALAVDTPQQGWVILRPLGAPAQAIAAPAAQEAVRRLAVPGAPYWQAVGQAGSVQAPLAWYLAGTTPEWQGSPMALAVLVETDDPTLAQAAGQAVLRQALGLP